MRLVIVTGLSGAGKSTALKMLEDDRYFCVDNLPVAADEQVCIIDDRCKRRRNTECSYWR